MKVKIVVTAEERDMIVSALQDWHCSKLAQHMLTTNQDPADDGPEVAILRTKR